MRITSPKITILILSMYFLVFAIDYSFAEEQTDLNSWEVIIPFGAYDPSFDTPVENWYEPPVISIQEGDTVTWINNDKEGHTVTSGKGPGRFGWMGGQKLGEPTDYFESGRFMEGNSWSFTFNETFMVIYIQRDWSL